MAALDAIQGEADSFPYNGSVKARNALFLDTELRSGSMLTGFQGGARVTTLLVGQIDLNSDPGALSRVSNGVFSQLFAPPGLTTDPFVRESQRGLQRQW
jgi:hypothetical protein